MKPRDEFDAVERIVAGTEVHALVVDDIAENREVLSLMLTLIGCDVTVAENGEEALQGKLLRVLEDGEISSIGSTKPIQVDVRVIAASNADLPTKILDGSFRQDLYFRLARYVVDMPPLRERLDDLSLLVSHFLRLFSNEMGMSPPAVSPEALALLQSYTFPGNVRELKNVIERTLIESGGESILRRHIHLLEVVPRRQTSAHVSGAAGSETIH
jgi:DNA-binding NtrC family response regulator